LKPSFSEHKQVPGEKLSPKRKQYQNCRFSDVFIIYRGEVGYSCETRMYRRMLLQTDNPPVLILFMEGAIFKEIPPEYGNTDIGLQRELSPAALAWDCIPSTRPS
jgi:hypothetical protein